LEREKITEKIEIVVGKISVANSSEEPFCVAVINCF
jgi:hypothetical protein